MDWLLKEGKNMDVLMIVLGCLLFAAYMRLCGSQRKPIKSMAANSALGVLALLLAALISGFLGCGISVDYITVFAASVLGIPGVAMMLLIMFVI